MKPPEKTLQSAGHKAYGHNMPSLAPISDVPAGFVPPDWNARLDLAAVLRAVPESATIAGMYLDAILKQAKNHSLTLPGARERYLPYEFYPVREHIKLMLEAAQLLLPDKSPRVALRIFGRSTPATMLSSTLGRVMLGSVEGVHAALDAVARSYALNIRPSSAQVLTTTATSAIVRLMDVSFLLDSNHVGIFEGTMLLAGVRGSVLIDLRGPAEADLLCRW